jgi:hypothetical protein
MQRSRPPILAATSQLTNLTVPTRTCCSRTSLVSRLNPRIQRQPDTTKISVDRKRIESRRGKNIAKVAAARKLLTLVYYGLRDGHIRALTRQRAAA